MKNIRNEAKSTIVEYIDQYYSNYRAIPSVRDIAAGTGISVSTVHRCLKDMKENGELEYRGRRSVSTQRIEMEGRHPAMAVLGYGACGEGQEETEEIIEYIRMPESLIGQGEFFALIAKGESMVDAGIAPGDYVVIRKQNTAEVGDIVVALDQGVNNLKVLGYNKKRGRYFLRSCNPDRERYADIYPEELRIQGVAVCVSKKLGKVDVGK
ncbi:MAG: helix-turn-helix domain-containing protein [Clostridia bacterium]|nr:helix-turn-helix domain-containing protein [Clostridia bacterium]